MYEDEHLEAAYEDANGGDVDSVPVTWYDEFGEERGDCELCGESLADNDVGEFWNLKENTSVVAHAQCGIDAGMRTA